MRIKLVFDSQFCGEMVDIVDVPDCTTYKEVEKMFEDVFGIKYDDNCYYEVIDGQ